MTRAGALQPQRKPQKILKGFGGDGCVPLYLTFIRFPDMLPRRTRVSPSPAPPKTRVCFPFPLEE
jgi:hypothetical protein